MNDIPPGLLILGQRAQNYRLTIGDLSDIQWDHTTMLVVNSHDLSSAIEQIPTGVHAVFFPGSGDLFSVLKNSIPLLTRLKDKGILSIKVGGYVLRDVSARIVELQKRQSGKF